MGFVVVIFVPAGGVADFNNKDGDLAATRGGKPTPRPNGPLENRLTTVSYTRLWMLRVLRSRSTWRGEVAVKRNLRRRATGEGMINVPSRGVCWLQALAEPISFFCAGVILKRL